MEKSATFVRLLALSIVAMSTMGVCFGASQAKKIDELNIVEAAAPKPNDTNYFMWGDYDRLSRFDIQGNVRLNPQFMGLVSGNTYETVITIKKGQYIEPLANKNSPQRLFNAAPSKDSEIYNYFTYNQGKFTAKEDGTYQLRMDIVDNKANLILFKKLESKYLAWSYSNNETAYPYVRFEGTTYTNQKQVIANKENGNYILDVSAYLYYGHKDVIFSWGSQNENNHNTGKINIDFLNNMSDKYVAKYFIDTVNQDNNSYSFSYKKDKYITSNETRIWFDRQGHYDWGYFTTINIWNNQGAHEIPATEYIKVSDSDNRYVLFYDVPLKYLENGYSYNIKGYKSINGICESSIGSNIATASLNSNAMQYINDNGIETNTIRKNNQNQMISIAMAKKIMEGYFTCLNNTHNGYKAINDLESNMLGSNNSWISQHEGDDLSMPDFSKTSLYMDGVKDINVNVLTKIDQMRILNKENNNSYVMQAEMITPIVISIFALATLSISLIFVINKRKRKYN